MQPRFAVPTVSLLIAAALVALSAFGIVGLGRDGFFNFDGQVLWAAGRTWLQGANPYDYPSLARAAEGIPGGAGPDRSQSLALRSCLCRQPNGHFGGCPSR